jgi:hypothetical protein
MTVLAKLEVTTKAYTGDLPRDYMVNNLTFSTEGTPGDTEFAALANAVMNVWKSSSGHWGYPNNGLTINAYDYADPLPRPERAHVTYTPSTWATTDSAPRQVALCASFFCGRNLKRTRGRVYLYLGGNTGGLAGYRPSTSDMNGAMNLLVAVGAAASALSPVWLHSVYSQPNGNAQPVTDYWVNDVWDTQRRRAPKEQTRVHNP